MSITIAAINALPHAEEIKQLFVAHARPEFPEFFDRAYPAAVADGATSWVGRDPSGQIVMHIACFPRRFTFGRREVRGGLMVNLMVASRYRAFFPALKLLHRLIQDCTARGVIDFLYADPNEESSALLRGTRFARLGTLQRFVLPIRGRGALDLPVRFFHAVMRRVAGAPPRVQLVAQPAERVEPESLPLPAARATGVMPQLDHAFFKTRLAGYPGSADWWLTSPEAAILVRGPDATGAAALQVARRAASCSLWALLPDLIAHLRRRGCDRLQVMTLAESEVGQALRRAGFVPRPETVPLFAYGLTPLGAECLQSAREWEITSLDCDR